MSEFGDLVNELINENEFGDKIFVFGLFLHYSVAIPSFQVECNNDLC